MLVVSELAKDTKKSASSRLSKPSLDADQPPIPQSVAASPTDVFPGSRVTLDCVAGIFAILAGCLMCAGLLMPYLDLSTFEGAFDGVTGLDMGLWWVGLVGGAFVIVGSLAVFERSVSGLYWAGAGMLNLGVLLYELNGSRGQWLLQYVGYGAVVTLVGAVLSVVAGITLFRFQRKVRRASARVVGSVLDVDGSAVCGAEVRLFLNGQEAAVAVVQSSGAFAIENLVAGFYVVVVQAPRCVRHTETLELEEGATGDAQVIWLKRTRR